MEALPTIFLKVAWQSIADDIDADAVLKARLYDACERSHERGMDEREFVRNATAVLYGHRLVWPQAEQTLRVMGEHVDLEAMVLLLYRWLLSASHKLYRRGQIRSLLSHQLGHIIQVTVDDSLGLSSAPCGAVDGVISPPTSESLRRIPPCKNLLCSCSWILKYPD